MSPLSTTVSPDVTNPLHAIDWLRREVASNARRVPLPGSGRTLERWRYLADVAAQDLVHGRLIEGHLDAMAILAELDGDHLAGRDRPHAVWAADPADMVATFADSRWRLTGSKRYCSGSVAMDGALVTATATDGPRLFLLGPAEIGRLDVMAGSWPSTGMVASASETLHFDLEVGPEAAIGLPGAYVERRGFWAGGAGVAACWLGGATAVVDRMADDPVLLDDPGAARAIGTVRAQLDATAALARETAALVDDSAAGTDAVRTAALGLRTAVGHAGRAVLAVHLDVAGTRLACLDGAHARRVADLAAYLTQLGIGTAADYESARLTRGAL
jgi:alkylation response protein AidB-like acyl-CoA dehydrogenase